MILALHRPCWQLLMASWSAVPERPWRVVDGPRLALRRRRECGLWLPGVLASGARTWHAECTALIDSV